MNVKELAHLGIDRNKQRDMGDDAIIAQRRSGCQNADSPHANRLRGDGFERSPNIDYFNNYSKSGCHVDVGINYVPIAVQIESPMTQEKDIGEPEVAPNGISTVAVENPAAIIVETSRIDELTEMLMNNDLYMSMYTDRLIRFNSHNTDIFIEDKMPDEFKDVYVEFGFEVLKAQDQKEFLEFLKSLYSDTNTSQYNSIGSIGGLGNEVARYLKANSGQFDIDKIIEGNDKAMQTVLRQALDTFLFRRALNGETLTESERLFSTYATHRENAMPATFSQKMEAVSLYVNLEVKKAQQNSLSDSKFTVSLSSDFTFVVSGDDDNEAQLLQDALNSKKGLLSYVIWCAQYHRSEDGSYVAMNNQDKALMPDNTQNSFSGMSKAYADQLGNLATAYNQFRLAYNLSEKFGLALADFEYKNGVLSGKTPDAEAFLFSREYKDGHYEGPLKTHAGSNEIPNLDLIIFEYKDGKFSIVYK